MVRGALKGRPELWGGIEGSVVRIDDRVVDQMHLSGHDGRKDDLDRVASLGVTALRCLVSWERVAPDALEDADWSWTDRRLVRMRDLGLRSIVGLVHHGSGPRWTSLVEDSFVDGLARFAGAAAARYPWIDDWTPVNEPLTTARFSGLYGHWHPHGKDDATFARALVVECRAVAAAMKAIRQVNPHARLVQTEDLGRCFATPDLAEEAAFQNERRWVSLDLLCGRLAPGDVMWEYLRRSGVAEDALEWFRTYPCPPDIIGIDHYLNSERLLDSRQEHYPEWARGRSYADVDAVRVCPPEAVGPYARLREAWDRYQLPLAVTEAHHGSTREEQLRWLLEVWATVEALAGEGVDIRAMTVWSLFGAYDWNSLLTRQDGFYEPGAFDVRTSPPRETAIAGMVRELASGVEPSHPVLAVPGWWRRPIRARYGVVDIHREEDAVPATRRIPVLEKLALTHPAPLLIRGGETALGLVVRAMCDQRGLPYCCFDGEDAAALSRLLEDDRPWAVVDVRTAASNVDASPPRRASGDSAHASSGMTVWKEAAALVSQPVLANWPNNARALPPLVFSASPLVTLGPRVDDYGTNPLASSAPLVADGSDVGRRPHTGQAVTEEQVLTVIGMPAYTSAEEPGLLFLQPSSLDARTKGVELVNASALVSLALDLLIDGAQGYWCPVRPPKPGA